jgi:Icc-related predicted phosphoesterase
LALLATPMPAGVRPTAQISGFAHYSAGTTPAGATVVNVAGDVITYGPAQAANSYVFIDMFWIR